MTKPDRRTVLSWLALPALFVAGVARWRRAPRPRDEGDTSYGCGSFGSGSYG